jgi:hypothetical protein
MIHVFGNRDGWCVRFVGNSADLLKGLEDESSVIIRVPPFRIVHGMRQTPLLSPVG